MVVGCSTFSWKTLILSGLSKHSAKAAPPAACICEPCHYVAEARNIFDIKRRGTLSIFVLILRSCFPFGQWWYRSEFWSRHTVTSRVPNAQRPGTNRFWKAEFSTYKSTLFIGTIFLSQFNVVIVGRSIFPWKTLILSGVSKHLEGCTPAAVCMCKLCHYGGKLKK